MYYSQYKNIRDAAWQCLDDYCIAYLPVEVRRMTMNAGIIIYKNSEVSMLKDHEMAVACLENDQWSIIYDDTLPDVETRFSFAHELGHIFLAHDLQQFDFDMQGKIIDIPKREQQASSFATRLLCPSCVLWALELHTAEEIAQYCQVPLYIAEERAKRMKTLYKRNSFLKSPQEQAVFKRFLPYIQKEREKRGLLPIVIQ